MGSCGALQNRMATVGVRSQPYGTGVVTEGYTAKQMMHDLIESGGLPGGKWRNDEKTVYVDGMPQDVTELDLYKVFASFGAILPGGVTVHRTENGMGKPFAYVNYADADASAAALITLNDCQLPNGTKLRVQAFNPMAQSR